MGTLYDDFKMEAEKSGYFINEDVEFVESLSTAEIVVDDEDDVEVDEDDNE